MPEALVIMVNYSVNANPLDFYSALSFLEEGVNI